MLRRALSANGMKLYIEEYEDLGNQVVFQNDEKTHHK